MGVVDLMTSITGIGDFARVVEGAETVEIRGRSIRVIGLPDLITAKEALGREKDRLAVKELRAIQAKKRL
jgi:hypothetical protein